jgi:hypothetical protein
MARRRANAPGLIGAVQHETGADGHFDIAEGLCVPGGVGLACWAHGLGGGIHQAFHTIVRRASARIGVG